MFLTDFCTQKYTGGIISWVGIFLTVTPGIINTFIVYNATQTLDIWP